MDFKTTMFVTLSLLAFGMFKLMYDAKKAMSGPTGKKVAGHLVDHFIRNIFR